MGKKRDGFVSGATYFDQPATYQIRVWGWLDESWSERLAGMHITVSHLGTEPPITKLTGNLPDQAALSGVLNRLYDLGLPVISVRRLNTPEQG